MLRKPLLARCDNRDILAKEHPKAGNPSQWLSENLLVRNGYLGVSFDYFVNWKTGLLSEEAWVKRIVNEDYEPWPDMNKSHIQSSIDECDGAESRNNLANFASRYSLRLRYQLFKESVNWQSPKASIVTAYIDNKARVANISQIFRDELAKEIRHLSGGPVTIGQKGLFWGTSTLECYLSHTDAAWPGDVDLIVTDINAKALAILEFKKHTVVGPIQDQKLANYYPRPDGRKYDRIAILRNYLGSNIPIVIVYHPTRIGVRWVKLELVGGKTSALKTISSQCLSLPSDSKDTKAHQKLMEAVMTMAGK